MEANKELALSKDPEGQTYVAALEAIGENKYFADATEAEWYLPAFIDYKYPNADTGSRIVGLSGRFQEDFGLHTDQ